MVSLMSILLMTGTASAAHTLLKEDTLWNLTMVHKWPMSAASLSLKAAEVLELDNDSSKQQKETATGLEQVADIQAAVAEDPMLQSLKDHAAAVKEAGPVQMADTSKIKLLSAPITNAKAAPDNAASQKVQAASTGAAKAEAKTKVKAEAKTKAVSTAKSDTKKPAAAKSAAQPKKQSTKAKAESNQKATAKKAAVKTASATASKTTTKQTVSKQSKKTSATVGSSKPTVTKTNATTNSSLISTPSGKTYRYKKQLTVQATAYTAAASENGQWGAVDYFGNKLKVGTIAVDPNVIPLGTKLYITGYKYSSLPQGGMIAVASDMGGAIKGNRIDVFVPDSSSEAQAFGIQQLKVYIIE